MNCFDRRCVRFESQSNNESFFLLCFFFWCVFNLCHFFYVFSLKTSTWSVLSTESSGPRRVLYEFYLNWASATEVTLVTELFLLLVDGCWVYECFFSIRLLFLKWRLSTHVFTPNILTTFDNILLPIFHLFGSLHLELSPPLFIFIPK